MMRHVIRIELPWLRCPLLLIVFPFTFMDSILWALFSRHRWVLGTLSFYTAALDVFEAAWRGEFVPK